MTNEVILQELENISLRLGVTIRYERGDFAGGFCRIDDGRFIILNKKFTTMKKIHIIANELSKLDIENIFIIPKVKEVILKNSENEFLNHS